MRDQLRRWRVDRAVCLPDYATFHLGAAQNRFNTATCTPQLDYFVNQLAKLAELNTQVDEALVGSECAVSAQSAVSLSLQ